jgi:glycine/D-amino acid oxidase-like deaminating enzyme
MILLEQARAAGVELISGSLESIQTTGGRIAGVRVSGMKIACEHFISAAGPFFKQVGLMLDLDLPVFSERHIKMSIKDQREAVPRDAPLLIWDDAQHIVWSDEERSLLSEDPATHPLLAELPAGVHCRPEGGAGSQSILILWPYDARPSPEVFPISHDPSFPEVALRGLARMIPALKAYIGQMPRAAIDGGYYTKTLENRPLIGPIGPQGAYGIGALSGFGLMASLGAADLLAAHITHTELPGYAAAFALSRYDDPAYQSKLNQWGATGQL